MSFMKQSNNGFFSQQELLSIGLKKIGENVLISRFARFYNPQNISIGNNVRIDDFTILSGNITIGNFVHIGAFSMLTGSDAGITIEDFCSISNQVRILSISDDYSGEFLTNPCIPMEYKKLQKKHIIIKKHCIIGSGSLLLPDAFLDEGVAVGAMSMVVRKTTAWGIYFGIPAKRIKERKKNLLELEKIFIEKQQDKQYMNRK